MTLLPFMTSTAFTLLVSVVFTFGWLYFFVRRDRHPEPLALIARTFAWGMFSWLVAATLGAALHPSFASALAMVLLTAVLEESSKLLAASTALTSPSFDEPMDGLVYAVTAALGFALMENLTYALGFGSGAATWHALLTTLAHAMFSAPQGYALGGLHWQRGRRWVAQGLALSVLLHFAFNGILSGEATPVTLAALALTVLLMILLTSRYYLQFEAEARRLAAERGWLPGRRPPGT